MKGERAGREGEGEGGERFGKEGSCGHEVLPARVPDSIPTVSQRLSMRSFNAWHR